MKSSQNEGTCLNDHLLQGHDLINNLKFELLSDVISSP